MDFNTLERLLEMPNIGEHSIRQVACLLRERAIVLQKCAALHEEMQAHWTRQLDKDQDWEYEDRMRDVMQKVIQENGQAAQTMRSRLDAINTVRNNIRWSPDVEVMTRVAQVHNLRKHHDNLEKKVSRAMEKLDSAEKQEASQAAKVEQATVQTSGIKQELLQAMDQVDSCATKLEQRQMQLHHVTQQLDEAGTGLQTELRRCEQERLQMLVSGIQAHLEGLTPKTRSYLDHLERVTDEIRNLDINDIVTAWKQENSSPLYSSKYPYSEHARHYSAKSRKLRPPSKAASAEAVPQSCERRTSDESLLDMFRVIAPSLDTAEDEDADEPVNNLTSPQSPRLAHSPESRSSPSIHSSSTISPSTSQ